jgi:hypothetical protein
MKKPSALQPMGALVGLALSAPLEDRESLQAQALIDPRTKLPATCNAEVVITDSFSTQISRPSNSQLASVLPRGMSTNDTKRIKTGTPTNAPISLLMSGPPMHTYGSLRMSSNGPARIVTGQVSQCPRKEV